VRDYLGRPVPEETLTHSHPSWSSDTLYQLHLLRSIASSLFSLRSWQSSLTTSLQVLFGLPLALGPSASYSMHFFTQSLSSFCSTCTYHRSLFCCNTSAMSSIPKLSQLLGNLSFSLCHTSTWAFSSLLAEVPPHFLSLRARSDFHATYLLRSHAHTIAVCSAVIPVLCHLYLNSLSYLLGNLSFSLCHTSTWAFSSLLAEVPPHFISLRARFDFHATYCFAHNYCATFLSQSMRHPYW